MTTLKAIARRTGFSVSVVSRALNPKPDANAVVSQETRLRIQQAARQMGYQPNRAASFLKRGRLPEIGLFMPGDSNRLTADLTFGLADAAQAAGFPISIHHGMTADSYRRFIKRNLAAEQRCGLVTYPYFALDKPIIKLIDQYQKQGGQLLLINPQAADASHLPFAAIDDRAGGQLAARRLLERGCQSFVMYGDWHPLRREGFAQCLENAGRQARTIPQGRDMYEQCLAHLTEIRVRKIDGPVGLFASTDREAVNLATRLAHTSWQVGRQVLIVGYDNLSLTGHIHPALTTIDQPFAELGRLAGRMMTDLIHGRPVRSILIPPTLVIRQTA